MTLTRKKEKSEQLDERERARRKEEKVFNSCCSFQSRLGPPEYRKRRRVNGLQLPLHPQQIMGWTVLLFLGLCTFLVLIPALTQSLRQCLLTLLSSLFVLHILSHLAALLLDPADPQLRALKVTLAVPEFDRSKHAHVIENGRCHLCNIKTSGPRTKHCSVCNKCVGHFDHHCKWLNHCVGGRNYIPFLICVVSAVVAALIVTGLSVTELVYYHTDPYKLSFNNVRESNSTNYQLPEPVFLSVVSVLGVLAATTAALLLHLCLFHCYIATLGITTYEYIRHYRQGANVPQNCQRSEVQQQQTVIQRVCCCVKRDLVDVSRTVQPFVITLDSDLSRPKCPHQLDGCCRKCLPTHTTDTLSDSRICKWIRPSARRKDMNEPEHKIKCNQVRPTTDDEITRALEKIATLTEVTRAGSNLITLPALPPPQRRLKDIKDLRQLENVFDMAEQVDSFHYVRPYYRSRRKKNITRKPMSPSLSPIHESGYSNPSSPRVNQIQDPSPPQATIFLSMSPSPASSEEEVIPKYCRSEDLLKTPQLPRKCYSPKTEQLFIVEPNYKSDYWNPVVHQTV